MQRRGVAAGIALLVAGACVLIGVTVYEEPAGRAELYGGSDEYYVSQGGQQQQLARTQGLAKYAVTGNIRLPEGGVASPPMGVILQFPSPQTQAEGETDEDDDKVPKEARKKEEKEKQASRQLERDLKQTEGRSRKIGSQLRELTRWIREQTSNVIRSVQAQNAKLTQKINDVPLTPGDPGPRGLPGVPGKNGMNGAAGVPGPPGISGDAGQTGPPGMTGPTGTPGAYGKTGPSGNRGPVGPKGRGGKRGRLLGANVRRVVKRS